MIVKSGDTLTFISLRWNEAHWEFDHPTVVISPFVRYSPNGLAPEQMIEDLAIDLCCGEVKNHDYSDEFTWRGWSLGKLKRVANERLSGKDTWKSFGARALMQKVRFKEVDGSMEFEIIEQKEH